MEIVREAAEGVSTSVLAERFGVSVRAIQYTLKADAERQTDAAIPVSAVSVKVTASELEALDEVLTEAGIEAEAPRIEPHTRQRDVNDTADPKRLEAARAVYNQLVERALHLD